MMRTPADREDGKAVDQTDERVAPDDQADLGHQKDRAEDVGGKLGGADRGTGAFGAAEGEKDHESREDPVADHDHHDGRVLSSEMF
jgi:hypothetical protein